MPRAWSIITDLSFEYSKTHICDNVGIRSSHEVCMSRLTIDITNQQHQSLKALAALQVKLIPKTAI